MPLADPPRPSMEITSVQQVVDYLIGYVRWFSDFINHIDTLNVEELDAVVVNTGTLNANLVKIAAANGLKSFTLDTNGIVANNGTIDTMKFDLATGLLTIVSALIQSATGYPKVELNSATNLLAAYQDANNHVDINPLSGGAPSINWFAAGAFAASLSTSSTVTQLVSAVQLLLQSTGNLNITSFGNINLTPSGSLTINSSTGQSASISYVKNVAAGVPSFGTMNFTKGILTSFT